MKAHEPGDMDFRSFYDNAERALYARLLALPRVGAFTAFAAVLSLRPGAGQYIHSTHQRGRIRRALRLLAEKTEAA